MKEPASIYAIGLIVIASMAVSLSGSPSGGMPDELRGIPLAAAESFSEIRRTVEEQLKLADKAREAETPNDRMQILQQVRRNVQFIAQKRVVVMEAFAAQAQARVVWARKHASEVRIDDLVISLKELAQRGPPAPPFIKKKQDTKTGGASNVVPDSLASLPGTIQVARDGVVHAINRLDGLHEDARNARSEKERERIRQELQLQLKTVEKARVAVLEAVLDMSKKRLAWAKQRAKEMSPAPVGPRRESTSPQ